MSTDVVVILSTLPPAVAEQIAETLVTERLAACVNLLGAVRSIYRWDGAVQRETEQLALIKTTEARREALCARLRELHPYTVPEILAVPVTHGLEGYLDWVRAETREP